MSSSRTISPEELKSSEPLSLGTREYFRARLRNRLYNFVVSKYVKQEEAGKITQRALARRIRRRPDVINRLLAAPGNWTLDTVSDLLLGIGPEELDMSSRPVINRPSRNASGASALDELYKPKAAEDDGRGLLGVFNAPPLPPTLESLLDRRR